MARGPNGRFEQHTGDTMVLAVDPHHLRRAADDLRGIAIAIDELAVRPGLGVPGQRAWESARCLAEAVDAWGDYLRRFGADLHRMAGQLATVADAFAAADEAALALVRSAA
jgi:hypothetical protein